ncbi:hypothetical protein H0B56_17965 [Haloechinothrix sp. YIM 98757]|uniref:YGGT family protein n=1 Tax=Haloechinothrix aidingensis TaxID=2752311 RepID=A0A838ADQ8_9PSEU|nr:hypothetical protein [Haloechinothrix aidingensis]MBA0127436.1 hypothetical protein [Haloechinothrix aidingensis]
MSDHAKDEPPNNDETRAIPRAGGVSDSEQGRSRARRSPAVDWRAVKDQFVGVLAGAVRWVGLIFAVLLVLHVVFTLADANPDNSIVDFVTNTAPSLTLGFENMFTFDERNTEVLVNFGIAALLWLVISSVGASIIRRLGGAQV